MNSRKARFVLVATSLALTSSLLAACGDGEVTGEGSEDPAQDLRAAAVHNIAPVLVLTSTDPAELALTASQSFFEQAPVVVLADADDETAQDAAAAAALDLHAPVLLTGGAIADSGLAKEVERLGAVTAVVVTPDRAPNVDAAGVVTAGAAAVPALSSEDLEQEARKSVEAIDPALDAVTLDAGALVATADGGAAIDENDLAEVRDQLPDTASPRLLTEVLALVDEAPGQTAALATAQAAGVVPLAVAGGDPWRRARRSRPWPRPRRWPSSASASPSARSTTSRRVCARPRRGWSSSEAGSSCPRASGSWCCPRRPSRRPRPRSPRWSRRWRLAPSRTSRSRRSRVTRR